MIYMELFCKINRCRIIFLIALFLVMMGVLTSCGDHRSEQGGRYSDTSIVAWKMVGRVPELQLPLCVETDSMRMNEIQYLDEHQCNELLPNEFDYSEYLSVDCIGFSVFRNSITGLWFHMRAAPELEGMSPGNDIYLVLYDSTGLAIQAEVQAYSGIGYMYSFVSADSVLAVNVDEMEDIRIHTLKQGITNSGFVDGIQTDTMFEGNDVGFANSLIYRDGLKGW